MKVGSALASLAQRPNSGVRHPPRGGTSDWYVWGGLEFSSDDDFFQPVHIGQEVLPAIIPYLALPPGWRFQIAPGHEDLWFDADLLTET